MVFTTKFDFKSHQLSAIQFCLERRNALISYAPGTGKTRTSIAISFKYLKKSLLDKFVFVVTKSSLIEVQNEFQKFTDVDPVICDTGEKFISFLESTHKICIVQYNWIEKFFFDKVDIQLSKDRVLKRSYSMDRGNRIESLLSSLRCGICFDEVHQIKNPSSNLSKVVYEFRKLFKNIYGFTGTPITRNLEDLYHVVNFISEGSLGTLMSFKYHYMEIQKIPIGGGRKIPKVIGYKNLPELNSRISNVVLTYFPKSNILYEKKEFDIRDRNTYMSAAKGLLDTPIDSPKEYSSRLVDLQYTVNKDEGKKIAFLEVLEEALPKGLIVFCSFYETVSVIEEILDNRNIPHRLICGKDDTEDRKEVKDWFNSSPEGKVLLVTMAGSQSINLQSTNYFLFFDIPFGVGKFVQALGRIVRMNSSFSEFHIIFLIAKECIDEYKYEFLAQNRELLEKVLLNEIIPEAKSFPKYNDFILRKLKRSFLWKSTKVSK